MTALKLQSDWNVQIPFPGPRIVSIFTRRLFPRRVWGLGTRPRLVQCTCADNSEQILNLISHRPSLTAGQQQLLELTTKRHSAQTLNLPDYWQVWQRTVHLASCFAQGSVHSRMHLYCHPLCTQPYCSDQTCSIVHLSALQVITQTITRKLSLFFYIKDI